jgi:fumarate hydratase subunit beta
LGEILSVKEHYIDLPLKDSSELEQLSVFDKVYFNGEIYVFRDQVHKKIYLGETQQIEFFNFLNSAVYYCASTPKKSVFVIGSCGPTSSYRMDGYTEAVLKLGFKVMIGKGYRNDSVISLCKQYKAIYCITYGGCGALLNKNIISSELVAYKELETEAMYKFVVKNFPVFVAIDVFGNAIWKIR